MKLVLTALLCSLLAIPAFAGEPFEKDVVKTSAGDLEITFIGHGTLMLMFNGKVIHVDPYTKVGDYSRMPKADLILITHEHQDHLDLSAIEPIRTKDTKVVLTEKAAEKLTGGTVMKNGDTASIFNVKIEALPAYNLVHKRDNGQPFHIRGMGNAYLLTFGDKRVFVAGDTENTPEMKALREIDIAFLPMNLPYTMTPEMVADAAKAFRPKVLYPYHTGETDTSKIVGLMKDEKGIEVRIRKMK